MIILFVLGLLLGAVSVIFALQNVAIITVTFFSWHLTGSLAVILLLAITSGVFITALLLLPEFISSYLKYKNLRKNNEMLTEELRKQKELLVFSQHASPTAQEISRIEQGAIDHSLI